MTTRSIQLCCQLVTPRMALIGMCQVVGGKQLHMCMVDTHKEKAWAVQSYIGLHERSRKIQPEKAQEFAEETNTPLFLQPRQSTEKRKVDIEEGFQHRLGKLCGD